MKKKFIFFISLFVTICLGLVMTGLIFNKTENEKQNGLSTHFDVSVQDTIAYVTYDDGEPSLHLYNQDKDIDATAFQLEKEYMILDPTFSHDGATLAFIAVSKNLETNLSSTVYLLDLRTYTPQPPFTLTVIGWHCANARYARRALHKLFRLLNL
ncbi:hypothetical protein [Bacillus alveayuensis]|jgi:hypothetical protein|uniref:hypothetical protein n=1 Tax=Aeribacillus alveayuensis TaxID=279215 RepID=UPI001269B2C5|nr:hypothetical protein [Bacillus alveayuensis]